MKSWIAIPVIKSNASQSISTRGHGKRVGKNLPNPRGMEKPGPSYCILFLEMKSPKELSLLTSYVTILKRQVLHYL